ncbi:MAG: translation elongation factor Ts, partial [Anaerolineaceae bacterium]
MTISTDLIKELRDRTGAGILACREALEETSSDLEKAVALLRERGLAAAAKKADRETHDGVLDLYNHGDGRVGVIVEVNCETDFVARTEEFRHFAHEMALQIAATSPRWIRVED